MKTYDILIAMNSGVVHGVSYPTLVERNNEFDKITNALHGYTPLNQLLGRTKNLIEINKIISLRVNPSHIEAIQIWDRDDAHPTLNEQPVDDMVDDSRVPEDTKATIDESSYILNPSYR